MYYVEIKENKIIGKCVCNNDTKVPNNFIEVTKEQYDLIRPPSHFKLDNNGNIIDIVYALPDIIDEDKIAMAEAIVDLNNRILELEAIINGGK